MAASDQADPPELASQDVIDAIYGCLKDLSGDPLAELEADHRAEIAADDRCLSRLS
jgi:hypothetical protein